MIAEYLNGLLRNGPVSLGQVVVSPKFTITHMADTDRTDLVESRDPNQAVEIARYDEAGKYRPLKSAANLKRGWRLVLRNSREVLLALDFLYPSAVGTLAAWQRGELRPVSVRETLARQTGMYAVVKKITDEQIHEVKRNLCGGQPPCLRQILWSIDPIHEIAAPFPLKDNAAPILCGEICNLFVAEGRKVVKKVTEPEVTAAAE